MLHGREAAEARRQTARETFAGGAGEDLPTLAVGDGMTVVAGADRARLSPSNKEAQAQDRRRRGAARRYGERSAGGDRGQLSLGKKSTVC